MTLYRIIEKPVDFGYYQTILAKGYGLDPMKDGKKSNFKLRKDLFVALIGKSHSDINVINEHIEPWLINYQKKWDIE